MGAISNIIKAASEGIRAIKEPVALPEAAARGTASHPVLLEKAIKEGPPITQRAPGIPFKGEPLVKEATRETAEKPMRTAFDSVQEVLTSLKGFVDPYPTVSKDISEKLYKGAWRKEAAHPVADADVGSWYKPLQRDPVSQTTLVSDYLTTMDEVAQATKSGRDKIRDIPLDVWQASAERLQKEVDMDPEVQETVKNIRTNLDDMFNDMAQRGWIDPKRYLSDYTPIRRLNAMLDGLAEFTGEDPQGLKSRLLSAQQKRGGPVGHRETDILNLLRSHRTEYLSKIAQHEAFVDIISDPTVNFTDKYIGRDTIDKGLKVYRPGAGLFGSTAKTREGYLLDSYMKAIDPDGKLTPGGYVLPEKLVTALESFNKRQLVGEEGKFAKASGKLAKWLTVYNPANTQINRASDLAVAMFLPEEGTAHPIGVLKWYGKATKAAYGRAFGDKPYLVNLHGRTVDIADLAVREGLTTGTIQHEVGGEVAPLDLMRLTPEGQQMHNEWLAHVGKTMEADRLATEMAPRIAAGLEAVERTGDWSQFGKVGRDITFRYGAGAPALSRFPIARAMAPFMQFQGLATQRMLAMADAKGMAPKARLALGLIAVPMAIHSWNTQNDEYKAAEASLPEYERNQMHAFMPDPNNPAKVKRDVSGAPVALRFRLSVPDQVAAFIGLGNAAPRLERVFSGRDTPMQFAQQSVDQSAENVSSMLVIPSLIKQVVTRKTEYGKDLSAMDLVNRVMPVTRLATDTYQAAADAGPGVAAETLLGDLTGTRQARSVHADTAMLDAQLKAAQKALSDAHKEKRIAAKNGPPSKLKAALKKVDEAADEVRRVAAIRKKENAPKQERPPKSTTSDLRDRNRQAVKEWKAERKEKE